MDLGNLEVWVLGGVPGAEAFLRLRMLLLAIIRKVAAAWLRLLKVALSIGFFTLSPSHFVLTLTEINLPPRN
jgi:hypothetical protein